MTIFNKDFSCGINNLISNINYDKISIEDLQRQMEEIMTKQEIEKKYGSQIHQMPNGLWWMRLENGRVIKLTKRENIIKKLIELEKNEPTLLILWNDFFEHRKISKSGGTVRIDKRNFEKYILNSNIANMPISQVQLTHLEEWAKNIIENEDIKERRFDNIKGTLSKMFPYAIQLKIISVNPIESLNIHRDKFIPKIIKKERNA